MDNSQENEELIDRYLMGMADEAEVERLDARLKADENLRRPFLAASRMDSHLREQALEQSMPSPKESTPPQKLGSMWLNAGTAAALLIGLFAASVVWAVIPQRGGITRTSQVIVSEDFENSEMKLASHLPDKANQWFGRVVSISPEGGVAPVQGSRVGQLNPVPGNRTESLRYLVDLYDYPALASGHVPSLQVKAFFAAPFTEQNPKFRVELAAFSEAPADVRQAWKEQREFGERVLQQVVRNYAPKSDEQRHWHEVSATLEIPEGTRSVVISLGVFHLHPDNPVSDFYLDAIELRLVDTFEPSA